MRSLAPNRYALPPAEPVKFGFRSSLRPVSPSLSHTRRMDWKTFASSIVASIMWPVVVLALGVLFRSQLVGLLARLTSLKTPGVEATFSDGLARVEEQVISFQDSEDDAVFEAANQAAESERLAGQDERDSQQSVSDPSGTVIRNWEDLTLSLFQLRSATAGRGRPSRNIGVILEQLVSDNVVNRYFADSVLGLQNLRNRVAHGEDVPNAGAALVYAKRADELRRAADAILTVKGSNVADFGNAEGDD
jgi:hypothetical protein